MEGRQPTRMHVELVRQPDTIAARAAAVAAAGWDVSTWAPCDQPIDFARRQPACDGVVIGESNGDHAAVVPGGAETTILDFNRYPRPSQGSCSGERTTGMLLVMISPHSPEEAQALRDWGDFIHLRHIAEHAPADYRTMTPWENAAGGEPRYCHFYEMVGDDPQATYEAMTPRVEAALSPEDFKAWAWHPQLVIDESRTYRRTS